MNTKSGAKLRAWGYVLAWMGVIYFFSAQPNSGEATGHYFGVFNMLCRKLAHLSEYAILFALLRRALICTVSSGMNFFITPFCLSVIYAISDEYHQSFVPGRSASAGDVLFDASGAFIGWLIVFCWSRRKRSAPSS